jgi:hypothetical protein
MPRKRSKSPKHRSRSKRAKSKAKSRSKSRNKVVKYGGVYKLWGELKPASSNEKTSKYGFPVSILIQKWTEGNDYKHPSYLEDSSTFFRKHTLYNMLPSYVERVPLLDRGEQIGYTISEQWRVGDVNNFTFRTAEKIPKDEIIGTRLCNNTYPFDFPCFIVYDLSRNRNRNGSIFIKVYKLKENDKEIFNIHILNLSGKIVSRIPVIGQDNFLAQIESDITGIVTILKKINDKGEDDLPNYDK